MEYFGLRSVIRSTRRIIHVQLSTSRLRKVMSCANDSGAGKKCLYKLMQPCVILLLNQFD